ncbi:MFS transporter [Streptomyces yaizuensis]|uniref:MFS transporter n=1 Tax=Streptomyces yaizuensis TaxID=2989713 RepID=A0ABQ5P1J8_9ACTN|nr:MFS transporter [Streptomyces sp. YSPA8]GLF96308.1 MFS transporter [Streptomyces sp. YSPA8]
MLKRYVLGALAARTGDEMSGPALLLAGLAATGSAAAGSSLLAAATVAAAAGGPLIGALLDRSARPGRLLAWAIGAHAGALAVLAAGLGRIPHGWTLLIATAAGLLGPALSGGWTSRLPTLVPATRLPRSNALDAMTFTLAGLAGPALAGTLAHLAGAATAVTLAATLMACALPIALGLPPAARGGPALRPAMITAHREVPTATARRPGKCRRAAVPLRAVLRETADGFRILARNRALARATAVTTVSCTAEGMLVAAVPLLGTRLLGGPGQGVLLLAAVGVAALTATTLAARRPALLSRPDAVLAVSPLVLATGCTLAAVAALGAPGGPWLLAATAALLGLAEGPQLTAVFAIRHREAPARLRAQVFTTGASLKLTGFATGAATGGPLALHSLPGALLAAAGTQLLAAAVGAALRTGRR